MEILSGIVSSGAGSALPPDAAIFIANYTNSEEEALILSNPYGLYPNGPNMILGYYSPEYQHPTRISQGFPDPRQAILDYGLTLAGPNYGNTFDTSLTQDIVGPNVSWAFLNNKKTWHHMRPITAKSMEWSKSPRSCSGIVGVPLNCDDSSQDSTCRYDHIQDVINTTAGQECLRKFFEDHIIKQVSITSANNTIEAWYAGPDDYKGYADLTESETRIFMQIIADAINTYDPKKRPFFMAHRGDFGSGGWDGPVNIIPGFAMQWYGLDKIVYHYLWESEISQKCGSGQLPLSPSTDWNNSQYRNAYVYGVLHLKNLFANSTCYTGKPLLIVPILADYEDIQLDGHVYDLALTEKWHRHDFWATLITGAHGINYYSNAYSPGVTTKEQNQYILNQFGVLTQNGDYKNSISRALLWGQAKTDLNFTITNGARTYTPMNWGGPNIAFSEIMCQCPTWQVKNLQYRDKRFILMINSHPVDTVNVTVSGFPAEGLDLVNIETQEFIDISGGSKSFSIPPHDVRLLEVRINPAYE